jgi:uncharacterized protein (TIGR00297 family)
MAAYSPDILQLLVGTGVASVLAVASFFLRALTVGGAIAMIVIGSIVFGFGGAAFGVPIVFFFVSASLLSRIRSPSKTQTLELFSKTGPRDYRQVLANGGTATLCTALYAASGWPGWFLVYLAAIGEACADTWATEIGTLSHQRPVSVISLRRVEPGSSGGMTFLGTFAALIGAVTTVMSGYVFAVHVNLHEAGFSVCFLIPALCGFAGSVADSVMGATIQGQYIKASTGRITEKPYTDGLANELIGGFRSVDNDVVNLSGTIFGAGVALLSILVVLP